MTTSFVKQAAFSVDYAPANISKWRSERTGLQVTYIDQPSPIVNGYFAVATEIENNSGSPHTLEHLVFMGSKKYPYKGLLDNLGNRLYSSTNAWTAVDQTVYTLTTAGWLGFKTLLPIYLDHLFNPTLTDEACLTEVYHIDGKGKEKGVVFSEMQGIESQSWFISFLKMQQLLYSSTSGYSSETGGLMSELRHLTNDQIQKFHASMYRPDNLCVIITGSVDEEELISIMTDFDNELAPLSSIPSKRPFVDSEPDKPLTSVIISEVEFPDNDESTGELLISWIGPEAGDTLTNVAMDMLGSYFTDSPISLFNKNLIEVENPFATDIDYTTDDYLKTVINFNVNGVPTEKLEELDSKIKELVLTQTDSKNFDLKYIKQIINQQRLKYVSGTEKSASMFSNIAISEFIYGNPDGSDLSKWCKDLNEYDTLLTWTAEQWADLIKCQLVDNKSATVLGKPSAKLNEEYKKKNKQRSKDIKTKYGKEGLKELQIQLDAAQAKNDLPIPHDLILKFERPDPSKIDFIKTKSYKGGNTEGIVNVNYNDYIEDDEFSKILKLQEITQSPLFFHFEDFKSQFTTIDLVMSSTRIEPKLLSYMSIMEEIFSLSIQYPNGKYIPFDEVISLVNNDLIEFHLDNGYESQFLELINVKLKFESTKYSQAIDWLTAVTKYCVFEEARIKIIIEKIINSLPDKKRNGELMMYSSQYRHLFNNKSLRKAQDSIHTESFYKELLAQINRGEFAQIAKDLETLKLQLFKLDNIKVFVVGNVNNLDEPLSTWNKFIQASEGETNYKPEPFDALPRSFEFKSERGAKCKEDAYLVISPAAESTHLTASTVIPTDYLDEDIFKIALATEFLVAVEGPFWRGIRGTGLAYGANIRRNIETGFLTFNIYRGADPRQAWITAKSIVDDYALGNLEIDTISIENAIAAIVNELANGEDNSYDAANSKISDNIFKRRGPQYVTYFLSKLSALSTSDVVYALNKYFKAIFDAQSSVIFTSLPPAKAGELGDFFRLQGYNITTEHISGTDEGSDSEMETGSDEGSESESGSESENSEDDSDDSDDSEAESDEN